MIHRLIAHGARRANREREWVTVAMGALLLAAPAPAEAGMPSLTFTEMAALRVESISFFLLGFVFCAWLIQRLWNGLARDFVRLPRLTYGKAASLTALWGLLFLLVLTMISGARELMTPGAWQKHGLTYKLGETSWANQSPQEAAGQPREAERREALEKLRDVLWRYGEKHEGRLPGNDGAAVPDDIWQIPGPSALRYLYFGGQIGRPKRFLVAVEPRVFGATRLGLWNNAEVSSASEYDVQRAVEREANP